MTITYTAEVATCRGFGCFLKLLLRWRGSIYKLVWLDLLAFLFLYYFLNIIYRFALNEQQKVIFEAVAQYCYNYSDLIPLSFVLGFYVSIVMTRWWNQYTSIPWPDPIAVFVSANIHGQDERGRVMRRTIMRYVCLCLTMVLINISPRVKKRFPNLDNLVEAGLLNENEKEIIDAMNKSFPRHSKHWLPIVWAASIITRARKEGRIRDDFAVKTIIDEINKFRGQCGLLISYDTISVPLVYTQVVTLAVYSYFVCAVMGQQNPEGKNDASGYVKKIDLYFPVFTTLQFFFYMGWLKVAESLINPFGEDDDDFEVNWMVDRNLQVAYLIVDEMHHEHPELIKDQYWDEVFPNELPYTVGSERFREAPPEPSTAKIEVSKTNAMPTTLSSVRVDEMVGNKEKQQSTTQLETVNYEFPQRNAQEEEADDASGIHFTAGNGKTRPGSSPSLVSLSGTISRVNTVTSALKRFLSREDRSTGSVTPSEEQPRYRFPGSASQVSLSGIINKPAGSMRITDQVIEEVDEQATITSQRANDQARPSIRDIFPDGVGIVGINGVPTTSAQATQSSPTEPIDIPRPAANPSYMRAQSNFEPSLFPPGGVDALLSSSAPVGDGMHMDDPTAPNSPTAESTKSLFDNRELGSRDTVTDVDVKSTGDIRSQADDLAAGDDFDRLKAERERERQERQKKLVRTISTAPVSEATANMLPVLTAAIIPAAAAATIIASGSSADLLAADNTTSGTIASVPEAEPSGTATNTDTDTSSDTTIAAGDESKT